MNQELYERFKQLKSSGKKAEAKKALDQFVQSIESFEEKKAFTDWFFLNDFNGDKVRHELYESILFPVLVEGFCKTDPLSLKRLAETDQNLYQAESMWSQIEFKTKRALLREYIELCPEDTSTRQALLSAEIEFFRHCEHEWPAGILYGMDGASESDCKELLAGITYVRQLDTEQKYSGYLAEFETKVVSYQQNYRRF